jgi:hypothetical protein
VCTHRLRFPRCYPIQYTQCTSCVVIVYRGYGERTRWKALSRIAWRHQSTDQRHQELHVSWHTFRQRCLCAMLFALTGLMLHELCVQYDLHVTNATQSIVMLLSKNKILLLCFFYTDLQQMHENSSCILAPLG